MRQQIISLLCAATCFVTISVGATKTEAPVVDLDYGLWKATVNNTGQYYNFSNIRYGQAPIGPLRFATALPPLTNRSIVHDGQDGRICVQGQLSWGKERNLFTKAYLSNPNNISSFMHIPAPGITLNAPAPPQSDGRATEDCLFLDVLVPKDVYDNHNDCSSNTTAGGAPVIMWTYGGGFYTGYKDSQGNAAGLLEESMRNPQTTPGIVYVAINYRLGPLGWLSGPSFTAEGGTSNAGLYDQRLALEWIQQNIHLFGGDKNKVTMVGQSAGASSTLHQITAFGGSKGDAPFQQGYIQSPAFSPMNYNWYQEESYQAFLSAANVTSLGALRRLSSEDIIRAHEQVLWRAPYGSSGYGPVVDGIFVPQLPTLLLAQGRYAKNIRAVSGGHNSNERLIFTDPSVQNTSAFDAYLSSKLLPDATPDILNYISTTLYPDPGNSVQNGALEYNDTTSRLSTLIADWLVNCNLDAALTNISPNLSHAYLFTEGAGLHGEETPYTFYDYAPMKDDFDVGMVNGTVAKTHQDWMLNFVATGNMNGEGVSEIPLYMKNRTMGLESNKGLGIPVTDPARKERCEFWNKALYF